MNNSCKYQKIKIRNVFSPKFRQISSLNKTNNKNKKNIIYNPIARTVVGNYTFNDNNYNFMFNTMKNSNKKKIFSIADNSRTQSGKLHHNRSCLYLNKNNKTSILLQNTRPLSCSTSKFLPFLKNNNINNQNNNFKNLSESFQCPSFYKIESEKLYQETYNLKQLIKTLKKELFILSQENLMRDEQINEKENEINLIIDNNTDILEDNLNSNTNMAIVNLITKIKKEIKITENEIKNENNKIDAMKKSLFITKMSELDIESKIYETEINKITLLINSAISTKNDLDKKLFEIENLQTGIQNQQNILTNLMNQKNILIREEEFFKNTIFNLQNKNDTTKNQVEKINNEIISLQKRQNLLSKDKTVNAKIHTNKNGFPISLKTLYSNKITDLQKEINHYKIQYKFNEQVLSKLQSHKKRLIESDKSLENLKIVKGKLYKEDKITKIPSGFCEISKEDETRIENLRGEYYNLKKNEKKYEEKANQTYNQMIKIKNNYNNDIENNNLENNNIEKIETDNNEEKNDQSQIEFGIDNDNPYYTDDEENVPETQLKFNSPQFNQFTYILFKNFEAKGIILDEATNKIITPLKEYAKSKNITVVEFPSKDFENLTEAFTKTIMKVLNTENNYNHTLTKIFIGALLYNSEFNVNKFLEYFNILFTYTRNYKEDEEKYISKLKNKYKEQTKKLVSCISLYILNELNSSSYFPLLKMKDLLEQNKIQLKDKYIEFLFYYMKKFNDPDAKLGDLKFSLLNNIVPTNDTSIYNKENEKENNCDINDIKNECAENKKNDINQKETDINDDIKIDNEKKEEKIKKNEFIENNINTFDVKEQETDKENNLKEDNTQVNNNFKENNKQEKANNKEENEDDNSVTEIASDEYLRVLTSTVQTIYYGIQKNTTTNFEEIINKLIKKKNMKGKIYEYVIIDEFVAKLKELGINLSDLQLSCFCNKYSILDELRFIDIRKLQKNIEDYANGELNLEE